MYFVKKLSFWFFNFCTLLVILGNFLDGRGYFKICWAHSSRLVGLVERKVVPPVTCQAVIGCGKAWCLGSRNYELGQPPFDIMRFLGGGVFCCLRGVGYVIGRLIGIDGGDLLGSSLGGLVSFDRFRGFCFDAIK